jgi:hypothetical protein
VKADEASLRAAKTSNGESPALIDAPAPCTKRKERGTLCKPNSYKPKGRATRPSEATQREASSMGHAKLTETEKGSFSRLLLVSQSSPAIPFGTLFSGKRKCRL